MPSLNRARRFYLMEPLERRYFLSIVPIDATAGVPFEGLVATNLRLPAHATGLNLVNVMINGQWDYAPTAVAREDGTFDLYARMTLQRAGTEEMTIWFRNDITGGWDVLERGEQTVRPNHFNAVVPDAFFNDRTPGTRMREAVARFTTSDATRSLDQYEVEIDWFGVTKSGHLVREADGTVGAYVDEGYLPIGDGSGGDVLVTIRLAGAADDVPVAGFARANFSLGFGIGIGMFYGGMTSETDFRIPLSNHPRYPTVRAHFFVPAAESDGWDSTFTVELTWSYHDEPVATTAATLVRNADGTHAILGSLPEGVTFDNTMMRIRETVQRPAVDGMAAQTYTVEYVGTFSTDGELPVIDVPAEGEIDVEPEVPVTGGAMGSREDSGFGALAAGEMSALSSRGFGSPGSSPFGDALVGDDEETTEDASLVG